MGLLPYSLHRRTLLHVDLNAPAEERWAEAGAKIGDEIQEAVQEVVELVIDSFDELSAYWPVGFRWAVSQLLYPSSYLGSRLIHSVAGLFGQNYQHEIAGLARAAEVPYTHLLLANLMYDISAIRDSFSPRACSSFSTKIRGKPVLVRNMDWDFPESIGKHTVMVRFHKGRKSYASVGIAGMVGVLSALYRGNWAVTLNQAPVACTGVQYFQMPALQRVRQVCDGFGNFRSFVNRLQKLQTMSPFFAHVIGNEADQQVVINGFGDSFLERTLEDEPFIIQTNHFIGEESEDYNPEGFMDESDTEVRYSAIRRRLKKLRPISKKALWKVIARAPVTNSSTMQSMVMCPATNKLLLKVRV